MPTSLTCPTIATVRFTELKALRERLAKAPEKRVGTS